MIVGHVFLTNSPKRTLSILELSTYPLHEQPPTQLASHPCQHAAIALISSHSAQSSKALRKLNQNQASQSIQLTVI